MIPSNRRYQIRLYKFVPLPHLSYLSYTLSNSPARLSQEYLIVVIILHGRPSIININNIRTSPHRYYRYVPENFTLPFHIFISIEEFLFLLLLLFILTNKKKITKTTGAGIAGLALAIGLHNNHHHLFILYEEASEFSAVGYVHKLS